MQCEGQGGVDRELAQIVADLTQALIDTAKLYPLTLSAITASGGRTETWPLSPLPLYSGYAPGTFPCSVSVLRRIPQPGNTGERLGEHAAPIRIQYPHGIHVKYRDRIMVGDLTYEVQSVSSDSTWDFMDMAHVIIYAGPGQGL